MRQFFNATHCDRCGEPLAGKGHTMSKFNTDVVCFDCKRDEQEAPGYKAADEVEANHCRAGNYNFPGVGLSREDEHFLAERRRRRRDQRDKEAVIAGDQSRDREG
jgi:hypothetical protein